MQNRIVEKDKLLAAAQAEISQLQVALAEQEKQNREQRLEVEIQERGVKCPYCLP